MSLLAFRISLGVLLIIANGAWSRLANMRRREISAANIAAADWKALNDTIGGRLHAGMPLAEPCYSKYQSSFGTFVNVNDTACSTIEANYRDEHLHTSQFGGYLITNWGECQSASHGCNLNFSDPAQPIPASSTCYQGSVSDYYINCTGVGDIQAGLSFASRFGVPLVVKNTGHDYKGRSSGPNSLALWTHNIQPDIVLSQNFTPDGCNEAAGKAVIYGAGQQWEGLYEFAEANDIIFVGGSDLTVGAAGGWLLGGGHSFLSPKLGLGVDNALQIRAVLPNGTYVTANRCQNQDLFFALRGGGGSTFGVVVEVTSRAWDTREVQVANILFAAASIDAYNAFLGLATQNANKWASLGFGGGLFAGQGGRTVIEFQLYNVELSHDEVQTYLQPVFEFVASSNNSALTLDAEIVTFPTIWQAYQTMLLPILENSGIGVAIASRLISSDLLATSNGQQQFSAVLAEVSNDLIYPTSESQTDPLSVNYTAPLQILMTAPYGYTPVSPGESFADSSVTPAWRNSTWHVVLVTGFASQTGKATIENAFAAVNSAANKLRAITPQSGAYQNEADVFEPDPVAAFWGQENYDKLSAIKESVDPDNVLTCWDCIGSDEADERYRCFPNL